MESGALGQAVVGDRPGPDEVITCVDCGGRAHLSSYPPSERDWEDGDVVVYRCEDCLDRWDLVYEEPEGFA